MTELEQLKQQAQEITKRIESLEKAEKANGVWLPKVGDVYWYQSPFDEVDDVIFEGDNSDIKAINKQRVYPTKELAKANDHRKEKIAVWNKFREMEPQAVDWADSKQNKFVLTYCHEDKLFKSIAWQITQHNPETEWYTTSPEACEWVIANMQTELKKIWRV